MTENITSIKSSTPPAPDTIAPESSQAKQSTALQEKKAATDTPTATRLSQSEDTAPLADSALPDRNVENKNTKQPRLQTLKDALAKPFRAYPQVQMVAVARREVDYVATLNAKLNQQLIDKGELDNKPGLVSKGRSFAGHLDNATDIVKRHEDGGYRKMTDTHAKLFKAHIRDAVRLHKQIVAEAGSALSRRNAQAKKGEGSRFSKLESVYQGFKQFLSGLFAERPITTVAKARDKIDSLEVQIQNLNEAPSRKQYSFKDKAADIQKADALIYAMNESIEDTADKGENKLKEAEIKMLMEEFHELKTLLKDIKKKNS